MASAPAAGALLKTLVASKPGGNILELGTGVGYSLAWMLAGKTPDTQLTSLDNNPALIHMVKTVVGDQPNLEILCCDGGEWLDAYSGPGFDLIFADTWPG